MATIKISDLSKRDIMRPGGFKVTGPDGARFTTARTQEEIQIPERIEPLGQRGGQGFATGFTKSLLGTARNVAGGLQDVGQRILAGITPGKSLEDIRQTTGIKSISDATPEGQAVKDILTPQGRAEQVGAATSELLQFLVPAGKISKAGKVVQASQASKVAGLAGRAVTEAVAFGGITAAQEGDLNKNVRDVAIISAVFPVVGAGIKTVSQSGIVQGIRSGLSRNQAAEKIINTLIKPTKGQFSYGKNPGRAVSQEKIVASNLDDLERKISNTLDKRNSELSKKVADSTEIFDFTDTLNSFDDAIEKAAQQNNAALINRLSDARQAVAEKLTTRIVDGRAQITSQGPRNLVNLTAQEAVDLKREVGRLTRWTGSPSDDKLVNATLINVYRAMDDKIVTKIPDIKPLNRRVSDLISAEAATKNRAEIVERQNFFGFTERLAGVGGLITSVATGNPVPFIISMGASGFSKAMRTPAAQTRFAAWLANAPASQKKELFEKAPYVKAFVLDMIASEEN